MARPLRLTYEGAVYHVTARGIERGRLFQVDQDRERYLYYLAEYEQLGSRLDPQRLQVHSSTPENAAAGREAVLVVLLSDSYFSTHLGRTLASRGRRR